MKRRAPRVAAGALASVLVSITLLGASCAKGTNLIGEGGAGGAGGAVASTSAHKASSSTGGPVTSGSPTTTTGSPSTTANVGSTVSTNTSATVGSTAAQTTAMASSSTGGVGCHDPCLIGDPLSPFACITNIFVLPCASDVCNVTGLDYCCVTQWDQACVDEVANQSSCSLFVCM